MSFILIVDDELDLANLLDFNLRQEGFETAIAQSGKQCLELVSTRRPDLVLLDLMLPDVSGLEVCRQLKSIPDTKSVPVVMLTAKKDETQRIVGLEVGADDYITKPFSIREVMLRVKAVLRRAGETPREQGALELGLIRLYPTQHRCLIGGELVTLTVLEFRLLQYFLSRPEQVRTREQLLAHVWGMTGALETRTVDTHVMRLREKLGPARDYLETVRGVGYRMTLETDA